MRDDSLRDDVPLLSADHPDRIKKWRPCLGCGRRMLTDRGHRICKKCRRRNEASPVREPHHVAAPDPGPMGDRASSRLDY